MIPAEDYRPGAVPTDTRRHMTGAGLAVCALVSLILWPATAALAVWVYSSVLPALVSAVAR